MTANPNTTVLTVPPTIEDGGATLLAWLQYMRDEHPVCRDAYGVWHVFRYTDVAQVLSTPQVYSSHTARVIPAQQKLATGNLLQTDPPRHRQLRRLIAAAFSPTVITGLAPRIAALTHELLDATDGAHEFDLVTALAYPLPVTVIAELLGLPATDRDLFRNWADQLLATLDVADPYDPQLTDMVDKASAELVAYLQAHCTDRRAHPRQDLISKLVTVEADSEWLTDEEVVNFSVALLLAGHITTTALLGNTVLCLDAHPQLWAQLRADRSLDGPTIEEVLRYRCPITQLGRVTTTDTTLAGQLIPADALVSPWLLSANRDPRQFPDPDRFDIHRTPNHHVGFGHGHHFCIGQLLGRLEARIALGILLDRYTSLQLTPGIPLQFHGRVIFAARHIPITAQPFPQGSAPRNDDGEPPDANLRNPRLEP
jgi:cytochrome P450